MRRGQPRFFLMTDTDRLPDPVGAARRLPRNAAVIFRHYDAPGRDRLAQSLAQVCRRKEIALFIAGDANLAHKVGAQGLHLPQRHMCRGLRHKILSWHRSGANRLLSAAAHDPKALVQARQYGVDFILLSPIFPTASHPGGRTLGPVRLALWTRRYAAGVPVLALGGIDRQTVSRLAGTGVAGIAGIGGLVALTRSDRRYRF